MYETIAYDVVDRVATITLNRPTQHNAVNGVMSRELPLVWERFNTDSCAVVAIITGAGSKAFCTGADLSDLPALDGSAETATLASIRWTSLQNRIWKPVICAVNGLTVGGGLHFVADSDIVIASDTATFFDTHVKVGLVAGLESVSLCRRMPMQAVLRMALVGGAERITADQALALGMVGEVVAADGLMRRAQSLADLIKENSPAAMARTKQAIWESADRGLTDGMVHAWQLMMAHSGHPDFVEGGSAYLQKRPPRWLPLDEG